MKQHLPSDSSLMDPAAKLDIKKVFIGSLISGAAIIVLTQATGHTTLAVVLPISILLLYIRLGYYRDSAGLILDQFADSIYYLGFLFTLVALIVSLYYYRTETLDIGLLVSNFSLALTTTVVGLASRIIINNFRVDQQAASQHMENELEQAASTLVRHAKTIAMQLEVSHEEIQHSIQHSMDQATQGIQNATDRIEKHADLSGKILHKHMEGANRSITSLVEAINRSFHEIELPQDVLAKKLAEPVEQLVQQFGKTQDLVEGLNVEQQRIRDSTHQIVKNLDAYNDKLADEHLARESLLQLITQMSSLAKESAAITEQMAKQAETSQQSVACINDLMATMHTLPEDFSLLTKQFYAVSKRIVATFTEVDQNTKAGLNIASDLQEISRILIETRQTIEHLPDLGRSLEKTLQGMNIKAEMPGHKTPVSSSVESINEQQLQLIKQQHAELAQLLGESQRIPGQADSPSTDSSGFDTNRVKN